MKLYNDHHQLYKAAAMHNPFKKFAFPFSDIVEYCDNNNNDDNGNKDFNDDTFSIR